MSTINLRIAHPGDGPALRPLQERSVRVLGAAWYTRAQADSFIRHVGTMDDYLLEDGTYFVAELEGQIVGCGGWTMRVPGYARHEGDVMATAPRAKIRSVYVDPLIARLGVGRRIMAASEQAIAAAGFDRAELTATLSGVPFYMALGYTLGEPAELRLPDGEVFRCRAMAKDLAGILAELSRAA